MSPRIKRIPYGYDGPLPTGRTIQRLLPKMLEKIGVTHEQQPNVVLEMFQEILGKELSKIAVAKSYHDGILNVTVKNSTFLSVLHTHEKGRILSQLRLKCPNQRFDNIVFRVG
ncbi:MAG: DciA family protein [Chlamydiia bacterium]